MGFVDSKKDIKYHQPYLLTTIEYNFIITNRNDGENYTNKSKVVINRNGKTLLLWLTLY